MNFNKHIIPDNFKEHDQYREEKAVAAFVSCARELKANYSISGRFKVYRQNTEAVTVIIAGKSFTTRGDNALYDSCTNAIYHVLDSYSQFADLKKEKDRMLAEKHKVCKPKRVGVLIPARY
jgi:hypothetical protein